MDIDDLDAFYRATTFLVHHPGGRSIPIRVGQLHPALDEVLHPESKTWAFLTACNPRSVVLPDAENAARMKSLCDAVSERDYAFWPGSGISDFSDWKPEASLLVLGISRADADLLSDWFDQNAYVFGEYGGVAELVWTTESI